MVMIIINHRSPFQPTNQPRNSRTSIGWYLGEPFQSFGTRAPGSSWSIAKLTYDLVNDGVYLTGAFYVGNGWVAGGCWDDY